MTYGNKLEGTQQGPFVLIFLCVSVFIPFFQEDRTPVTGGSFGLLSRKVGQRILSMAQAAKIGEGQRKKRPQRFFCFYYFFSFLQLKILRGLKFHIWG